jgi:hypothetical protein
MPTPERKQWRGIFTDTIMELAAGRADVLDVASWAMLANHEHGDRDPREVAIEKFKNWPPPLPNQVIATNLNVPVLERNNPPT